MSLLNQIKKDQLQARKERDTVQAGLLTVLLAEATMVGKNDGNRETTDEEVISVIKKTIKNLEEVIRVANVAEAVWLAITEREILKQYLPLQMTELVLTEIIEAMIAEHQVTNMKGMGLIMKELKAHYGGEYDGKMASDIVKKLLSS